MHEQILSPTVLTRSELNSLLLDLRTMIKVPSVSAKKEGLEECAKLILQIMRRANINSELLYLDKTTTDSPPPIVFGEVKSKSNPNGGTILFYNHYDVQPVEPIDRWEREPFSGEIVGNKIFGRGSADDKGELMVRIKAVESIIKKTGDVPCNIKFIVEGGEEVGSPHLARHLRKFGHKLKCNSIVWEFGYVDTKGRPIINLGMKGLLYVELTAIGPSTDIHSSLAVLVPNPAWAMVKALNCLWDDKKGIVTIKDWYSEFRTLTSRELSFAATQPVFDEIEFKTKYGLPHLTPWLRGIELRRALAERPTCNISGISAGYTGKGGKTVLPAMARAMIDFRLVPDMIPIVQFDKLRKHLLNSGFNSLSAKFIHGIPPSRTKFTDPFVQTVTTAAALVFGSKPIINLSSAGSGPMSLLVKSTGAPCVAIGCSDIFSNIHSFNEFARIDLLNLGTKLMAEIIYRYASIRNQQHPKSML